MGTDVWYIIVAGVAPLVAAALPFFFFKSRIPAKAIIVMLALSGGLLFAIATLDLIPEGIEMSPQASSESEGHQHDHEHDSPARNVMLGVGSGFVLLLLIQQLFEEEHSHVHVHEEDEEETAHRHSQEVELVEVKHSHSEQGTPRVRGSSDRSEETDPLVRHDHHEAVDVVPSPQQQTLTSSFSHTAFISLGIHSLVDGLIMAGAFSASTAIGVRVAMAIFLHKIPDGIVLSTLLASANTGRNSRTLMLWFGAVCAATPVGGMFGLALMSNLHQSVLSFVLGFGAGSFVFISCTGIIPELLASKSKDMRTLAVACVVLGYMGFAFFAAMFHAH